MAFSRIYCTKFVWRIRKFAMMLSILYVVRVKIKETMWANWMKWCLCLKMIDVVIRFQTILPAFVCHVPSGSSFRQEIIKLLDFHCSRFCLISFVGFLQVLHYGQEIRFGFFGKYKTGLRRPPDFPLSRITAPISLHYSTADKLADATDVEILIPKLNSVIFIQRIDDKFNHIDFVWSMYSASLIYSKILDIFQRYQ